MPATSVYQDILDAANTGITNLNLVSAGHTLAVQTRKLPEKEETLDALPLIVVCPHDRPETVKQLSFEDDTGIDITYFVEVVLIFSGGRNFTANLDTILNFRQQVRRLFQKTPLPGSGTNLSLVFDVRPDPEYVLDRSMVNADYDYDGLAFWFRAAEPRTN